MLDGEVLRGQGVGGLDELGAVDLVDGGVGADLEEGSGVEALLGLLGVVLLALLADPGKYVDAAGAQVGLRSGDVWVALTSRVT